MPYRILSIDGGGLRGIIPLAILERLDRSCMDWRRNIDMYAGTSTGGLIALGLANGMSPTELMNVYVTKGPSIFERSLWQETKSLGEVAGPKYDSGNREQVCKDMLGTKRLGELARGHVVITAFDLDDRSDPDPTTRRWKAKIFHNMPTKDDSGDEMEYAYRVAMRTSAAPTYFSSYDGFVDGGVFANNPSMCALAQTQDDRLQTPIGLGDVRMLSLGTGFYPYHLEGDESWGLAQWAPRLINLLMDGVNEVADFQVAQMMADGAYLRIPLRLQTNIAMDDAADVGVLQRIGNAVDISAAKAFVESAWSSLAPQPPIAAVAQIANIGASQRGDP